MFHFQRGLCYQSRDWGQSESSQHSTKGGLASPKGCETNEHWCMYADNLDSLFSSCLLSMHGVLVNQEWWSYHVSLACHCRGRGREMERGEKNYGREYIYYIYLFIYVIFWEQEFLKGLSNLSFAIFTSRIACSYGPGQGIMTFFLINIFSLGL